MLIDAFGRFVFLYIDPGLISLINIDGDRVFRQIGIVDPIAGDAVLLGPMGQFFQVLFEPVGEHFRAQFTYILPGKRVGADSFGLLCSTGLCCLSNPLFLDFAGFNRLSDALFLRLGFGNEEIAFFNIQP